jgi:hypothetical protein
MLLAEIGERGQARLEEAVARVGGDGLCHQIAASYAARAGIGQILLGPIDETELAPSFLEHGATRAVVAGARAALASLRAAIGLDGEAPPSYGHR